MSLAGSLALDDLAEHLYSYLPGTPHPMADARLSFQGVAHELGLGAHWPGGSKQPAIRHFVGGVLNSGSGQFSALVLKIVERSITYRKRNNALTRDDIERLNEILARVGYKIPELHDPTFLDRLPRRDAPSPRQGTAVDPKALAGLQDRLLKLTTVVGQERGFAFETFLSELFDLHRLAPRGSFRLIGEQIDGSFQLKTEVYLLEAKWQDSRVGLADLLTFAGKVEGKAQWSRGLFVSYSGFTDDGLKAFVRGRRTSIVCMDGLDLAQVLSGRLDLVEVIERKVRRAAETNNAFIPVRELFSSVI